MYKQKSPRKIQGNQSELRYSRPKNRRNTKTIRSTSHGSLFQAPATGGSRTPPKCRRNSPPRSTSVSTMMASSFGTASNLHRGFGGKRVNLRAARERTAFDLEVMKNGTEEDRRMYPLVAHGVMANISDLCRCHQQPKICANVVAMPQEYRERISRVHNPPLPSSTLKQALQISCLFILLWFPPDKSDRMRP